MLGESIFRGSPMRFATLLVFATVPVSASADDYKEFLGHTGPTRAGLFTPDGATLVTCSGWPAGDGTIRVYDVKSSKELRKVSGLKGDVNELAMSPDGKYVYAAFGKSDGVVRGYEVATAKEVMKFEGQDKGSNVSCILVAPGGKLAASGGADKRLLLWETATGKLVREFKGHTDLVRCLAFTPDGKTLCSGSWDGSVKVWEVETAKELKSFKPKTKWVSSMAMLPDGKELLVGCDECGRWNIETGEPTKKYAGHGATCCAVSRDGTKFLTGWYDGKVLLREVASGKKLGEFQAHIGHVHGVSFSPDGKWFSTAGGGDYKDGKEIKGEDFAVRVWPVEE
jgi:WD40 repeat protein